MRHYGIIGNPLEHSFSAKYFNEKFATFGIDAEYSLYPIDEEEWKKGERLNELLRTLDGFNVTYPYKQRIIPYLDELDETAKKIGAVNVVHHRKGYNTDYIGFVHAIQPLLRNDRKALVLGTGGASKAVCLGLKQLEIIPTLVSRTPGLERMGYNELTRNIMEAHTLIINCTPLGMFPDVDSCPDIPYEQITAQHLLFDCVYNPDQSLFLRKGKAQGARTQNGIDMLIGQAKEAWKIWNL